eukprot:1160293-Pelagomonas_calceolata.AAC.3
MHAAGTGMQSLCIPILWLSWLQQLGACTQPHKLFIFGHRDLYVLIMNREVQPYSWASLVIMQS